MRTLQFGGKKSFDVSTCAAGREVMGVTLGVAYSLAQAPWWRHRHLVANGGCCCCCVYTCVFIRVRSYVCIYTRVYTCVQIHILMYPPHLSQLGQHHNDG